MDSEMQMCGSNLKVKIGDLVLSISVTGPKPPVQGDLLHPLFSGGPEFSIFRVEDGELEPIHTGVIHQGMKESWWKIFDLVFVLQDCQALVDKINECFYCEGVGYNKVETMEGLRERIAELEKQNKELEDRLTYEEPCI